MTLAKETRIKSLIKLEREVIIQTILIPLNLLYKTNLNNKSAIPQFSIAINVVPKIKYLLAFPRRIKKGIQIPFLSFKNRLNFHLKTLTKTAQAAMKRYWIRLKIKITSKILLNQPKG